MDEADKKTDTAAPDAEKQLEADGDDPKPEYGCGVGACQPGYVQCCVSIWAYTANISFVLMFHIALFTYSVGVIRTVEKRFNLKSQQINMVGSVSDMFQTFIVIFVGFFGRKTHKPRYISVTVLCTVLAGFMMATPYFIEGPKPYDPALLAVFSKQPQEKPSISGNIWNATVSENGGPLHKRAKLQTCVEDITIANENATCSKEEIARGQPNMTAWWIFLLAAVLIAFGSSGIFTLGVAFIDENIKKEDAALHIGVVTSMFAWGPILGFMLAAVCTRLAEDLGEVKLNPYHPSFIGCWWLGYVVFSVLIAVTAIPLFFFPKHLPAYYAYTKVAMIKNKKDKENKEDSTRNIIKRHCRDFPSSVWKLITNSAFVCMVAGMVCSVYVVVGIYINMPRYIEIHFGQPAFVANTVAGLCVALAGATGNILGGVIMKKFQLKLKGSVRMYVAATVIAVCGTTIVMNLGCPQPLLAGEPVPGSTIMDVTQPCNEACHCSRDDYQPVCSSTGVTYFSPCHAGCDETMINGTYTNCQCLSPGETLKPEPCEQVCKGKFIGYVMVFLVIGFLGSVARVPATIIVFRIIPEDLKSLALAINSSLYNLLAFVPGPILFGTLFDKACMLWNETCNKQGACLLYNITHFRYYMHGVSLIFQVLSMCFAFLTWYFIRKNFINVKADNSDDINANQEKLPDVELNLLDKKATEANIDA